MKKDKVKSKKQRSSILDSIKKAFKKHSEPLTAENTFHMFVEKYKDKLKILQKYPEMLDFVDVIIYGRKKYSDENWLLPDGKGMSLNDNCASRFRHLAAVQSGKELDDESGLPHDLHDMCRAAMRHVRVKRGIDHLQDLAEIFNQAYDKIETGTTATINATLDVNNGCCPLKYNKYPDIDDSKCITIEEANKRYKGKTSYYFDDGKKKK